jgi:methionyl-tRNA formyltransferase
MSRVVILSSGGEFTHRLLAALAERGMEADALVLYLPSARRYLQRLGSARKRLLALPLLPARWAAWRLRLRRQRFGRGARRVVVAGPLNGAGMARTLRALAPDVMLLAQCSIVSPGILAIPARATVNVHPGLLPWVRGNGPFANALLRGVPLGCTAFRVDAGIDTGPILRRRLLEVGADDTLQALREGLYRLWVEMSADVVADAAAGRLPEGTPQGARFPLGRTLPDEEAARAAEGGRAKALFDRWRPFCDPRDLALPADFDAAGLLPAALA